jgi:polyphenol oxidase
MLFWALFSQLSGSFFLPTTIRHMQPESVSARLSEDDVVLGLKVSADGVEWLGVPGWESHEWLRHGFSTRRGGISRVYLASDEIDPGELNLGELNLGFTAADTTENVRENRLRFVDAVTGSRETSLRTVRQVHSNRSMTAAEAAQEPTPEADGLMTGQAGMLLGIQTADCIPVLVADPVRRAAAAFHAGWRGTVGRIVELGVGRMKQEFGSHPADMIAAIGPGIGVCCYRVGEEVQTQFGARFSYAEELFLPAEGAFYLNLVEANRRQLMAAGLAADSIAAVGGCTSCQPQLFYSHRASGGYAGRMMAVIGIR